MFDFGGNHFVSVGGSKNIQVRVDHIYTLEGLIQKKCAGASAIYLKSLTSLLGLLCLFVIVLIIEYRWKVSPF